MVVNHQPYFHREHDRRRLRPTLHLPDHNPPIINLPPNLVPPPQLLPLKPARRLQKPQRDRQICPPERLEQVPPDPILGELQQSHAMAVDPLLRPEEGDPVVARQGRQHGVDLGVAQAVAVAQRVGVAQVAAAARGVEHEVGGGLVQLDGGEGVARVDGAQKVQQGRVVGLRVRAEDAEADGEEVGLRGEWVRALRGHDALAELAEGGEDVREVGAAWCGGRG